jgi:hypothetical protein
LRLANPLHPGEHVDLRQARSSLVQLRQQVCQRLESRWLLRDIPHHYLVVGCSGCRRSGGLRRYGTSRTLKNDRRVTRTGISISILADSHLLLRGTIGLFAGQRSSLDTDGAHPTNTCANEFQTGQ